MSVAFYAPMKSPHHGTPSGDREMARGLMLALADGPDTGPVELVSELRIYDGKGESAAQAALISAANAEAERLIALGRRQRWRLWVSYHNYYKAPDLLGPQVSRALGIPYVLVEATRAQKRLNGPWAAFARRAEAASEAADLIFYFTEHDRCALAGQAPEGQILAQLPPFLARSELPERGDPKQLKTILSVGMLRAPDKAASYAIIAEMLPLLQVAGWRLQIVGDGRARADIEALFAPFKSRVTFLGQLERTALERVFAQAAVFVWPGVNEAFGMAYLEAQAAGLAVVAQSRPGVRDVVWPGGLVPLSAGAAGLACAVDGLLISETDRRQAADAGRAFVANGHLLGAARATLWAHLKPLISRT